MATAVYIQDGEVRDYGIDFSRRMTGNQSGVGYGWWIPAGVSAVASSSANSGRLIAVRFSGAVPSYVYMISAYVDVGGGRRLIDQFELHCG